MMKLPALVLGLAGLSSAIHLPIQRVRPRLSSRSTAISKPAQSLGVANSGNDMYTAEVTAGTTSFSLQLDTGSSDLWFVPVPGYNQTFASATKYENLQSNLTYGTGWASGFVAQIDVEFAGYSVKNQSFLFVEQLSQWDINFEQGHPLYQGLAGLSFDVISKVALTVNESYQDTWGRSLMSNIFLIDTTTPNHIAFFLDRTGDLNDTDTGCFDIGTYATGYESVANMPKNPLYTGYQGITHRWNVLVNGLSINGKPQTLQTSIAVDSTTGLVNVPPKGSVSAIMDTGTSAAEIPAAVFTELYTSMGGVQISGSLSYAVPCMAEAQVVFTIGTQTVAVHPLDLTDVMVDDFGNGNMTYCVSAYTPPQYADGDSDIVLGDAFLRNVYAVYNYGDFVQTESGLSTNSPFIQILPLTDATKASDDFKQARTQTLASYPPQVDHMTINDPTPQPLSSSSSSSGSNNGTTNKLTPGFGTDNLASVGSTSGSNDPTTLLQTLATLAPIALALLGLSSGLLVILVILTGLALVRMRRQAGPTHAGAYVPVPLGREKAGEYKDEPTKYDS